MNFVRNSEVNLLRFHHHSVGQQLEESKNMYIFHKDGERWYIKFEDEELKPKNLNGLGFHCLWLHNNNIP